MLIDTHAHLNFNAYRLDVDEVIKRALDNNIWMLNVGSQYSTSKRAVEIAEKYPKGVYAAVGLHPIHAKETFCITDYKKLIRSEKVKAIGEIGLDYKSEYRAFKKQQKQVFLEQLDLAKELNLPIIFHCRFAHNDLLEILNTKYPASTRRRGEAGKIQDHSPAYQGAGRGTKYKGVVHCFTGTWQEAEQYLELGLYLGFNGIIFKLDLDEIIRKTPLNKILLETDCPFLTPPKFKGKRNNPLGVISVAKKIAEIKNIGAKRTSFSSSPSFLLRKNLAFEEVADITTQNAKHLFRILK